MSSNGMASPFLHKLPAELRNGIYRMALVSEEPLMICRGGKNVLGRTALLRTCRQIRSEATGIYYENAFHITCGSGGGRVGGRWLKEMRSEMRQITMIFVDFEMSRSVCELFKAADSGIPGSTAIGELSAATTTKLLTTSTPKQPAPCSTTSPMNLWLWPWSSLQSSNPQPSRTSAWKYDIPRSFAPGHFR